MSLGYILVVIGFIALFIWLKYMVKIPKCGNLTLITGGIKTGKSMLSVRMVYKTWKKQCLRVKIFNFLHRLFPKSKKFNKSLPKPLIYSNVPLNLPYVPLTQELLERRERFVYGSVCYLCEASLVADSMSFKDIYANEQLLLLIKLFAHETKGGSIFLDTQSVSDLHYGFKRNLSSYFYIHHNIKLPFFVLLYVREMKYSDDGSAVNTIEDDLETGLQWVLVPKKTWKLYDRYCYSVLTDHLPVYDTVVDNDSLSDLKARDIITLKEDTKDFMYGGVTREEIKQRYEDKKIEETKRINQKSGGLLKYVKSKRY